jgi:16S rRNA C967 or C1407 C5-methylase (RsmB/RsmF family)/NOL1/NOP2/fmu family ribosome biogenesis protein
MADQPAWPPDFADRLRAWLGAEAPAFFAALARRDVGLRLHHRRASPDALRARLPWETAPVPWCAEGVWLPEGPEVGVHPYHTAGAYYVQDPSAMAAAVLLDPRPGEWVLDVAAAPGGKASHIAARLGGEGLLVANDVARRRTSVLAMNLERMGVTNALITNEIPERLATRWGAIFDAVLVDAPCSGEGTFARDLNARRDWSLETVARYAHRQGVILDQTAPLLRPGGRLLYGTCTFAPEENEGVIAGFLARRPDFELADLPSLPGMGPGHPQWIGAPDELRRLGRFWPHTGPGHGHTYALLRRRGEPSAALPDRWTDQAVPGRVLNLYREHVGAALADAPPEAGLILGEHDELYITPMAPELWRGLRVLRPGWWVATLRHKRVNPDHALAMALRPEAAREAVDLAPDDPRVAPYLRGGHWTGEGRAGFVLVTVDGFPLGWAKRGGGRVRSRYPMHLRG